MLLKIGALVRISARRIKIAMASAAPAANVWRLAVPDPGSCSRLCGLIRSPAVPSPAKVKDFEGSATMPNSS
jgi:hypothetical protein